MADKTGIEWTDATWNPVRGCTRVSAGCQHCYAERVAARFSGAGQPYEGLIHPSTKGWNGTVRLVPEVLDQPLRWKRPRRIFVNSMSDLFHEAVPDGFIDRVFVTMMLAPQHTFQILTKRPERMRAYFAADRMKKVMAAWQALPVDVAKKAAGWTVIWPLTNVWLGVSVEDQAAADERIPLLLQCPAAVRWISAEPLLGPVDLSNLRWAKDAPVRANVLRRGEIPDLRNGWIRSRIDWVVAGGESGSGARPMHPDWARSLRDQCAAAGVPFLFKQWGEWLPFDQREAGQISNSVQYQCNADDWAWRTGKKLSGRLLDGVLHDGYPEVTHG